MTKSYTNSFTDDPDWGVQHKKLILDGTPANIYVCHVVVNDIKAIATKMVETVLDRSWMLKIDPDMRESYTSSAKETVKDLEKIFTKTRDSDSNAIGKNFGEFLVSMSATRGLEVLFQHISVPLAEIWKPQVKGNEGFDFHTFCPTELINYGEAKFSGKEGFSPYGGRSGEHEGAAGQADGFIKDTKHKRDKVYLRDLAPPPNLKNLDSDKFGVILAFSLNAKSHVDVMKSAILKAQTYQYLKQSQNIYIVGVTHG